MDLKNILWSIIKEGGGEFALIVGMALSIQAAGFFEGSFVEILVNGTPLEYILLGSLIAGFIDVVIRIYSKVRYREGRNSLIFTFQKAKMAEGDEKMYYELLNDIAQEPTVKAIASDFGIDLVSIGLNQIKNLKEKIAGTENDQQIKILEKQIKSIEKELSKLE